MANQGLEQTTVRRICSHAKMAAAAITYHFGSKENLITDCIKHCFKLLNEHVVKLDQELKTTPAGFAIQFANSMDQFKNEIRLLLIYFNTGKLSDMPEANSLRNNFCEAIIKRTLRKSPETSVYAEAFFYAIFQDQLTRLFDLEHTKVKRDKWLELLAKKLLDVV